MERSKSTNSKMVDARSLHIRKELVRRAVWIAILYSTAQLLGLREWTSALLEGGKCSLLDRIGCILYLLLYGGVVWVAPALVIAVLLLAIWDGFSR